MTSTTSCLSVLRFASPKDSGDLPSPFQLLTDRLIDHFESDQQSSVIQISNRYFTANVALLSEETNAPTLPYKEDGIVLVWYDHADAQDFTQLLTCVHEQVEAAGGGDLLRLCVGVSTSSHRPEPKTPKEIEEEYSKRVLWCLDRGYEYISSCDLSEEGVQRGHGERDKEGFARLVEAIQGTVWSSAVMEKSTKKNLKSSYEETLAAVEKANQSNDDNHQDDDELRNQYVPPDPSMLQTSIGEHDDEREKKAQEALMKEVEEEGIQKTSTDDEVAHSGDAVNERLFDQFEGAIQEASRIRDMSRSGQLSDEERRQRAGDAAMMLVNLLGQMGYDDDDEYDSSDDEEGKEEKVES